MTRALIVEDDPTTAAALAGLVRRHEWQAEVREDVASAWTALLATPFDFVLLDLSLPDGEGTDLLQKLRRAPAGALPDAKTPVAGDLGPFPAALAPERAGPRRRRLHHQAGAPGRGRAVLRAQLRRRSTLSAGQIRARDIVVDPTSRFVQKAALPWNSRNRSSPCCWPCWRTVPSR
jgi:two-component system OmpR family response regulator/two-component system response regulator QseB